MTLEEYYLAQYDIQNSIWLKLLSAIQHLGSNHSLIESNSNAAKEQFKLSKSITLLLALSTRSDRKSI
jgi:hypothetical protein